MLHFRNLISLILIFAIFSCDDDDSPSLPPVTTSGKNTLGFIVDGEIWTPCCVKKGAAYGFDVHPLGGAMSKSTLRSRITAHNKNIVDPRKIGSGDEDSRFEIELNFDSNFVFQNVEISYSNFDNFYRRIDASGFGTEFEILRIDTLTGIFSGKFDLDLYCLDGWKFDTNCTIHLYDGRFDVKLGIGGFEQ